MGLICNVFPLDRQRVVYIQRTHLLERIFVPYLDIRIKTAGEDMRVMRCKKRKRSHLFFVGLDVMHHCNIITEEVTSAKLLVLIFSAGRCGLREYSWLTTEFTDCLPTIFTAISLSVVVQASACVRQERNLRIMLK